MKWVSRQYVGFLFLDYWNLRYFAILGNTDLPTYNTDITLISQLKKSFDPNSILNFKNVCQLSDFCNHRLPTNGSIILWSTRNSIFPHIESKITTAVTVKPIKLHSSQAMTVSGLQSFRIVFIVLHHRHRGLWLYWLDGRDEMPAAELSDLYVLLHSADNRLITHGSDLTHTQNCKC